MSQLADIFGRMLDPVGRALSKDAALRLLELRADMETQARIDELADRCTEGTLSPQEQSEYEALVTAGSLIAVLQGKARLILAESQPAA